MYDVREYTINRSVPSSKECLLSCKEGAFLLPDTEIAVYRKQAWHRIHPKQIGDGMKVPLLYVSPIIRPDVLPSRALEYGLSLYQEYDENKDYRLTYLYKYAGGAEGREKINKYLAERKSTCTVGLEKGFTRLFDLSQQQNTFYDLSTSFEEQFACMIGVCLGYGKPKQIVADRLMSRHVGLPLLGSLGERYPLIQQLRDHLTVYGIFSVQATQKQHIGSLVQITIHDEQLLDVLEYIWLGKSISASRYVTTKESLLAFCSDKHRLSNSVLKFISK